MNSSPIHALLLLSDSALPLGSFAFSSGLESFLAHNRHANSSARLHAFDAFLGQSLLNVGSTALPYVLDAYRNPNGLVELDNDFDASTPCTVARRASVTQGRALLTIWERSLWSSVVDSESCSIAGKQMTEFASAIKTAKPDAFGLQLNGHFPPLFGVVCLALGLSAEDTAYLFLLNQAKAVLSAAVRSSVMGPYQSQTVLASAKLKKSIQVCIARETKTKLDDTAVTVPAMDLWMGRHELLYSRIFNS